MKAFLILKCDGRQQKGFKFCNGVENTILDLESVERTAGYLSLIQYLDKVPKIFDGPCVKNHIISNTLYKLQEMGYITEETYNYFGHFFDMHKICGLVLIVSPK